MAGITSVLNNRWPNHKASAQQSVDGVRIAGSRCAIYTFSVKRKRAIPTCQRRVKKTRPGTRPVP